YARLMSRGRGASGTGGAASAVIAIGSSSAVVQLLRSLARATTDPHQCPPRIDHGRARRTPAASPVTAGPPNARLTACGRRGGQEEGWVVQAVRVSRRVVRRRVTL